MMTKQVVERVQNYLNKNGIQIGSKDIRPWGSWDLVISVPEQRGILSTGQTFGWGYEVEEGFVLLLDRIFTKQLPANVIDLLTQYLTSTRLNELQELMNQPDISTSTALVKV